MLNNKKTLYYKIMQNTCPHIERKVYARKKCKPCYMIWYVQNKKKSVTKIEPKKKNKLPRMTELRALLNIVYKILCAELKPLHRVCEANLLGCSKIATQIHHKKGRRGILLIMSTYYGYFCDSCHKWCTTHSGAAKELGLSLQINSPTEYIFTPKEIELIKEYKIPTPKSVYIE